MIWRPTSGVVPKNHHLLGGGYLDCFIVVGFFMWILKNETGPPACMTIVSPTGLSPNTLFHAVDRRRKGCLMCTLSVDVSHCPEVFRFIL